VHRDPRHRRIGGSLAQDRATQGDQKEWVGRTQPLGGDTELTEKKEWHGSRGSGRGGWCRKQKTGGPIKLQLLGTVRGQMPAQQRGKKETRNSHVHKNVR